MLSPWVVRNIRFDESLGSEFHGYDLDFCLQVRAAGRKVVTADFRAIHHRQLEMVPDPEEWIDAHVKRGREVGRRMGIGGGAGSWKERALRAEAETDAPRVLAAPRIMLELRGPRARAPARARRDDREHLVADHGAAAVLHGGRPRSLATRVITPQLGRGLAERRTTPGRQ